MNYKEFYEKIITFDKYIEFRIMNVETGKMFSCYAENIVDVEDVYKKYDYYPYNIYYGINTRPTKERKEIHIPNRRLFYFDIEHSFKKPPLSNETYKSELLETAHYIVVQLNKKYSIKPLAVITSGRGLHLYYKSFPVSTKDYNVKFKLWFKQVQRDLDSKKPFNHIKFLDSVFDCGRIAGAPGTHHNKYDEKPLREILNIKPENVCDLQNVLDNFKMPEFKIDKTIISSGKDRKYNEKTIFNSPEFKVFETKIPEMKGYNVHSKLRVALILLMDKYAIQNREEVARRIESMGYWYEPMTPIEDPNYAYSESILNNWCLENWEFCLDKHFVIPYPMFRKRQWKFVLKDDDREFEDRELKTPWDIYYYAKEFNNSTYKMVGDKTLFYFDSLKKHIFKNIMDDKLKQWVEMNNFLEMLKVIK